MIVTLIGQTIAVLLLALVVYVGLSMFFRTFNDG